MSIEHRVITEGEFSSWRTLVRRAFNIQVHPDDIARMRDDRAEPDRLFGAFDGDQLVGTGGIDSHLMTVPGGAEVATAGIAYVSTIATHRRRGVLTGMMGKLLNQAQEREEPLAALWASESSIYARFGYGVGTVAEDWEIDPSRSAFAHMPVTPGKIRFVEHDEALRMMPAVWRRAGTQRAGFLDRSERRWRYFFFDEERVRGGWSGMFFVVYEENGEVEGYAAYRLSSTGPEEDMMKMQVVECVTATDSAHAALWRLIFDVDLVESISVSAQPPDDPVWWMLADARRLKRTAYDGIWVRVIDPVAALSARKYSSEGTLVIELDDRFLPEAAGVFELEASVDGGICRPSSKRPDITLAASELGATYLGGIRLSELERAGRVDENTPGSVEKFDRLFAADRAPWCAHHF